MQASTISDVQVSAPGKTVAYKETRPDPENQGSKSILWIGQIDDRKDFAPIAAAENLVLSRWSPNGEKLAFFQRRDAGGIGLGLLALKQNDKPAASYFPDLFTAVGSLAWDASGQQLVFSAVPLTQGSQLANPPQVITRARYKSDDQVLPHRLYRLLLSEPRLETLTDGYHHDSNPAWSPCSQYLAFTRDTPSSHDFSATSLWQLNLATGEVQKLCHEGYHAESPAWSPCGQKIAYFAASNQLLGEDEQFFRLWLVDLSRNESVCLTRDQDFSIVRQSRPAETPAPIWAPDGQRLFFRISHRGAICVASFNLRDGSLEQLTSSTAQVLSFGLDRLAQQLICAVSDCYHPVRLFRQQVGSKTWKVLVDPNQRVFSQLKDIHISRRLFPNSQGYSVEGWLLTSRCHKPPFPLLLDIHGGPHGFEGYRVSLTRPYRYALVSRGWAVLILNPSGSASYGQAFFDAIRGHWGERDMPEHIAAVDTLVEQGLADPERLAVTGYSYGGYMAAWLISQSHRFKAAVIGASVTNLESFYGTSDIGPWFVPWEMQEEVLSINHNCRRLSPVHFAKSIMTPTLILHGENDQRCPVGQGEELFTRILQSGNTSVEMVRYPNASHLFLAKGPTEHKVDYCLRLMAWIDKYTNL